MFIAHVIRKTLLVKRLYSVIIMRLITWLMNVNLCCMTFVAPRNPVKEKLTSNCDCGLTISSMEGTINNESWPSTTFSSDGGHD